MLVSFNKPALLDQAIAAHQQGRLQEAHDGYRQVLAESPHNPEALHMMGLLMFQTGNLGPAVDLIQRSLAIAANPTAMSNLAEIRRTLGQLPEAEQLCRQAIAANPQLAAAYANLSMILNQQRKNEEALAAAVRAVQLAPNEHTGYQMVGLSLMEVNRAAEALPYLEEAVRRQPNDVAQLVNLSICLERVELGPRAIEAHEQAVKLAPGSTKVLMSMGSLLGRLEKFRDAEGYFRKVLQMEPANRAAKEQLASVLMSLQRFEESITLCREIIAAFPDANDMYAIVGEALMGDGHFDEAIETLKKAAAIRESPALRQTLSNAHTRAGNPQAGLEELEKAIALDPQNPVLNFNKSIILFLMGRLEEAWKYFEWRWQHPRMVGRTRRFNVPQWDGRPLNGERVFLHAEQGMGDTIFFGRYATMVAERGGKPVVFCQTSMVELVKSIKGVAEVIGENVQFPPFDLHIPIMSLPGVFGTNLSNIPAKVPYISTNPEKSAYWKEELNRRTKKMKVGLVWEGGAFQPENYLRSCKLADYAPLGAVEGITFFGLQKGPAEVQSKTPPAGMDFLDLAPEIKDFSDTAAILEHLDMLVSIDTSVIHVAAALAKPVLMMLAFSPGHMWMLNRLDTPWYPTVRIFRQPAFKDWASPVGQVKAELERLVKERGGTQ